MNLKETSHTTNRPASNNFEEASARPAHSRRRRLRATAQFREPFLRHPRSNLGTNFAPFALKCGNQICATHVQIWEPILRHSRSNPRSMFEPFTFKFGNRFCAIRAQIGEPILHGNSYRCRTRFHFDGLEFRAGGGIILHGGLLLPRGSAQYRQDLGRRVIPPQGELRFPCFNNFGGAAPS